MPLRWRAAETLLRRLAPPPGPEAEAWEERREAATLSIDWGALPPLVDPLAGTLVTRERKARDEMRFTRKRSQVEAFAAALERLLGRASRATVVDFGCSSGNLVLPLAAHFPSLDFVAVDIRRQAIWLLEKRIAAAGLTNVQTWVGPIEEYLEKSGLGMDLALGLHVCGEASDRIIMAAVERGVPWALSPCCIGNLNRRADEVGFSAEIPMEEGETYALEKEVDGQCWVLYRGERLQLYGARQIHEGRVGPLLLGHRKQHGYDKYRSGHAAERRRACESIPALRFVLRGDPGQETFLAGNGVVLLRRSEPQLERPRSSWLRGQVTEEEFAELASTADVSQPRESLLDVFRRARRVVSLDRGLWARDRGYEVELQRLPGLQGYVKDDLLLGRPPSQPGAA